MTLFDATYKLYWHIQLPKALAFTRNPSDTSVTPARYTADGASDLVLVDQRGDIEIDGSDKSDNIRVSAAALASNALYKFNVRGFEGDDDISFSAALIQDTTINGNVGNDTMSLGTIGIVGGNVQFNNSYFLGGKGDDTLFADDINGGELNGNIGNDRIILDNQGLTGFNQYVGGGQGNDFMTIAGNFTDSIIDGNKGIDTIIVAQSFNSSGIAVAGVHNDSSVNGGEGDDIIRSTGFSKGLVLNGDKGNDTIASNVGVLRSAALASTINGGEGNDTIVSVAKAGENSKIDAGVGADIIVTIDDGVNSGATETIVFNQGDSVAATKTSFAKAAGIANTLATGAEITFGDGVDLLDGVNTSDKIDIDFKPSDVVDVTRSLLTTVLDAGTIYEVYGAFNLATNVFTVGAPGVGAESIYIVGGENLTLGQVFTNSTNMFVTTEDLALSSFV